MNDVRHKSYGSMFNWRCLCNCRAGDDVFSAEENQSCLWVSHGSLLQEPAQLGFRPEALCTDDVADRYRQYHGRRSNVCPVGAFRLQGFNALPLLRGPPIGFVDPNSVTCDNSNRNSLETLGSPRGRYSPPAMTDAMPIRC